MKRLTLLALAAFLAAPLIGEGRTKLVTLPERSLLLTNLENATQPLLVEERTVSLQEGTNHIDFSWANVSIQPESVELTIIDNDDIRIISTGFPRGENALTWEVYSPEAVAQKVRVSYLLNGIHQTTSYELRMDANETSGDFRQYLLISNKSGEDLDDATIRAPFLGEIDRSLSTGESRRIEAQRVEDAPIDKLFVARTSWGRFPGEDGETINMIYEIANPASELIPSGKIRVFSAPGETGSVFLGEDNLSATAPGQDAQTRLGVVRDVVLERYQMRDEPTNRRYNNNRQPVMFDREIEIRYVLKNFKTEPVTLRIHEAPPQGEWTVEADGDATHRIERKSSNEAVIEVDLPASNGEEAAEEELVLEFTLKNRFPHE